MKETLLLREAERRRDVELIKIKTDLVVNSPIRPETKIHMAADILEEASGALTPWTQDTRTQQQIEVDEIAQLEDFYQRSIEQYKRNKALIEEIERGE